MMSVRVNFMCFYLWQIHIHCYCYCALLTYLLLTEMINFGCRSVKITHPYSRTYWHLVLGPWVKNLVVNQIRMGEVGNVICLEPPQLNITDVSFENAQGGIWDFQQLINVTTTQKMLKYIAFLEKKWLMI